MERKLKDKLPKGKFPNVEPRHTQIMKGVRGRGNKTTEVRFRAALVGAGISGWQLHARGIPGNPDFYFPKEQLAVFIDGCFWHGCVLCGHIPNKNRAFWQEKINRNRERDRRNTVKLRSQGVSVLRFWEHEVSESLRECIDLTRKRLMLRKKQLLRKQEGD